MATPTNTFGYQFHLYKDDGTLNTLGFAVVPPLTALLDTAIVFGGHMYSFLSPTALLHGSIFGALQAIVASLIMKSISSTEHVIPKMILAHLVSGATIYAISLLAFQAGIITSFITLPAAALFIFANAAFCIGSYLIYNNGPRSTEDAINRATTILNELESTPTASTSKEVTQYIDNKRERLIEANNILIKAWHKFAEKQEAPPKDLALALAQVRSQYAHTFCTDKNYKCNLEITRQILLSALKLYLYAIDANHGSEKMDELLEYGANLPKLVDGVEGKMLKGSHILNNKLIKQFDTSIPPLVEKAKLTEEQRLNFATAMMGMHMCCRRLDYTHTNYQTLHQALIGNASKILNLNPGEKLKNVYFDLLVHNVILYKSWQSNTSHREHQPEFINKALKNTWEELKTIANENTDKLSRLDLLSSFETTELDEQEICIRRALARRLQTVQTYDQQIQLAIIRCNLVTVLLDMEQNSHSKKEIHDLLNEVRDFFACASSKVDLWESIKVPYIHCQIARMEFAESEEEAKPFEEEITTMIQELPEGLEKSRCSMRLKAVQNNRSKLKSSLV